MFKGFEYCYTLSSSCYLYLLRWNLSFLGINVHILPSMPQNPVLRRHYSRPCQPLLSPILFPYRHWQELGFLIVYVTSRPDFQKMKVMAWLAEHNFPYGLVTFGNGISKDLQRHKTEFLRYLVNDVSNLLEYKAQTLRERKSSRVKRCELFMRKNCQRISRKIWAGSNSLRTHESRRVSGQRRLRV